MSSGLPGVWPVGGRVFRPWKNGGGETAEILASPEGAGLEEFDWRISTARVDRSGPFSVFAGVDRILTVLEGGALVLRLPEGVKHLAAGDAPFFFAGDSACMADLAGDPVLDLNVMVRRPRSFGVEAKTLTAAPFPEGHVFALLLTGHNGFSRHDLVDLHAGHNLAGARALVITISAD